MVGVVAWWAWWAWWRGGRGGVVAWWRGGFLTLEGLSILSIR